MLAAILAAISGALGVVIGRFWDVHSESKRWRRDMRVRSYEGVAAAFYQYREVLREVSESLGMGWNSPNRYCECGKVMRYGTNA